MATDILVDLGEEKLMTNGFDGQTFTVGVYDDSTDGLDDTNTVSDITTEPTNANYSPQTSTFSIANLSGDFGVNNDTQLSFDFSDISTSEVVDAFYVEDGSGQLLFNAAMTQDRDIGALDSLDVAVGDLQITVN
jgi:hypothetical protein